jgi:hypothetical protein
MGQEEENMKSYLNSVNKAFDEQLKAFVEMKKKKIENEIEAKCPLHAVCIRRDCHRKKGLDVAIKILSEGMDSEFIMLTLRPSVLPALASLIKQERIRYGEWLIGEDEILPGDPDVLLNKGAVNNLYVRNYFRMKLRQRNKGEIE